jgi:hypothetical protein
VRRLEKALAHRVQTQVVAPLQRGVVFRRPRAHMLHIGKTGGTALKAVLESVAPGTGPFDLITHRHDWRLPDVPAGDKVFFVVRDPVQRFVSGFNSRLREGRPRYHTPWIASEQEAFERFGSADALGRALFGDDSEQRVAAHRAMISIWHVRDSYWDWFRSREYLESRVEDLLAIVWMPDLTASFSRLCAALGLPDSTRLPTDELRAHRSPADVDRTLSDEAIANLQRWYARDYAFLDFCAGLECFVGPSLSVPQVPPRTLRSGTPVTMPAPVLDAVPVITAPPAVTTAPIVPLAADEDAGPGPLVT